MVEFSDLAAVAGFERVLICPMAIPGKSTANANTWPRLSLRMQYNASSMPSSGSGAI